MDKTIGVAANEISRFREIAKIAKVHEKCIPVFCQRIDLLVRELSPTAKLANGNESVVDLRNQLKRIGTASKTLRTKLSGVEYFLDAMLPDAGSDIGIVQLVEYLKRLENAVLAAEQDAKQQARKGRPSGLRNKFDFFVFRLIRSARSNHGNLTIYKSNHGEDGWRGSL